MKPVEPTTRESAAGERAEPDPLTLLWIDMLEAEESGAEPGLLRIWIQRLQSLQAAVVAHLDAEQVRGDEWELTATRLLERAEAAEAQLATVRAERDTAERQCAEAERFANQLEQDHQRALLTVRAETLREERAWWKAHIDGCFSCQQRGVCDEAEARASTPEPQRPSAPEERDR